MILGPPLERNQRKKNRIQRTQTIIVRYLPQNLYEKLQFKIHFYVVNTMDYALPLTVVIYVLSLYKYVSGDGAFLCHSISDSCGGANPCDRCNERIGALEEKVKELQKLLAFGYGNVTSLSKDTVPTGLLITFVVGVVFVVVVLLLS